MLLTIKHLPLSFVNEFVFDGSDETFVKRHWSNEACFRDAGVETAIRAEFFDADGADGEFFTSDKRSYVEELAYGIANGIWQPHAFPLTKWTTYEVEIGSRYL